MNKNNLSFKWIDREQAIAAAARLALLKVRQSESLSNPSRINEVITNACRQMIKNKSLAIGGSKASLRELESFIQATFIYFKNTYN
jgi:hypothetical protein